MVSGLKKSSDDFYFDEKKTGFDYPTFSEMKTKKKTNGQITKLRRISYFFSLNYMFLVIGFGEILVLSALACNARVATLGCF